MSMVRRAMNMDAFQQHRHLARRDLHGILGSRFQQRLRDSERPRLQTPGAQPKSRRIPHQHLQSIFLPPDKDKDITSIRIVPQLMLNQRRQRIERLPHVRRCPRHEDPTARLEAQHNVSRRRAKPRPPTATGLRRNPIERESAHHLRQYRRQYSLMLMDH